MNKFTWITILGFATVSLVAPHQAGAVPTLRLSDGVSTHTITLADGAATDSNPDAGVVTYIGAIGNWTVNVTTGIVFTGAGTAHMDLNSINVSSTSSTGTYLNIYFSETGFMANTGYWNAAITGTARNSVQYTTYIDPLNRLFNTNTRLTYSGILGPGAFANTQTSNTMLNGPYSLTQIVNVYHGSGTRSSSFDAELERVPIATPVPEPSALLLLSTGFLALTFRRRKSARA